MGNSLSNDNAQEDILTLHSTCWVHGHNTVTVNITGSKITYETRNHTQGHTCEFFCFLVN